VTAKAVILGRSSAAKGQLCDLCGEPLNAGDESHVENLNLWAGGHHADCCTECGLERWGE
jgi:hypothetical protein